MPAAALSILPESSGIGKRTREKKRTEIRQTHLRTSRFAQIFFFYASVLTAKRFKETWDTRHRQSRRTSYTRSAEERVTLGFK